MGVFHPWANTAARVVLLFALGGALGALGLLLVLVRSPLYLGTDLPVPQPIEFDHRHHVGDEGVDCRFCHDTADRSSTAGMPPVQRCMGCHGQIWNESPLLQPLREAYFSGAALHWNRVHQLPDFVYFDHSIHLAKGIGCVTCHGRVDQMASVQLAQPLTMAWCLDCHRNPLPHLRPQEEITSMTWEPGEVAGAVQQELARRYDVSPRVSCTTCHR